jgi:redox-sensitive bicupin YhaK (pirin superfamily)
MAAATAGLDEGLASVTVKKRPGTCDPTGTDMMVVDCLAPFSAAQSNTFLLLHAFGPMDMQRMPLVGMHPHRGFNECP